MDLSNAQAQQISEDLVDTLNAPDCEFAVAEQIGRVVDPNLNLTQLRRELDDFATPLARRVAQLPDATGALLQEFRNAGFGAVSTAVEARHSNVHYVLHARQGIPISLAMLLLECGRRCGMQGFGINFPGHFLLSLQGLIIDPVGLDVLDSQSLQARGIGEDALQAATPVMIALRMLNNLKALHLAAQSYINALLMVDMQMAVSSGQQELTASLEYERGEYWEQLGGFSAAREAFQKCAELSSMPQLQEQARKRLQQLQGRSETWH